MMSLSPSVDLKGFASLVEPLLTVFASAALGLHCILMSLSVQGAPGGYLMRPREHKNMICIFILSSKEMEPWCCFVWSRCNIDCREAFICFVLLQPISGEHHIYGISTKGLQFMQNWPRDISSKCECHLMENLAVCLLQYSGLEISPSDSSPHPNFPKHQVDGGLAACPCLLTYQFSPQRAFMLSSALKVHATFSQMHFQQLITTIVVLFPTPAFSSLLKPHPQ